MLPVTSELRRRFHLGRDRSARRLHLRGHIEGLLQHLLATLIGRLDLEEIAQCRTGRVSNARYIEVSFSSDMPRWVISLSTTAGDVLTTVESGASTEWKNPVVVKFTDIGDDATGYYDVTIEALLEFECWNGEFSPSTRCPVATCTAAEPAAEPAAAATLAASDEPVAAAVPAAAFPAAAFPAAAGYLTHRSVGVCGGRRARRDVRVQRLHARHEDSFVVAGPDATRHFCVCVQRRG